MKRLLTVLLILVLFVSLFACKRAGNDADSEVTVDMSAAPAEQPEQQALTEQLSSTEQPGDTDAITAPVSSAGSGEMSAVPAEGTTSVQVDAAASDPQTSTDEQPKTEVPAIDPFPGVQQGLFVREGEGEDSVVHILGERVVMRYPVTEEMYAKSHMGTACWQKLRFLKSPEGILDDDFINKYVNRDGITVVRGTFDDEYGTIIQECVAREKTSYLDTDRDFDFKSTWLARGFTVTKSYGNALKAGDHIELSAANPAFYDVHGNLPLGGGGRFMVPTKDYSEADRSYLLMLEYDDTMKSYFVTILMIPLNSDTYGELDPKVLEYYNKWLSKYN